MRFIVANVPVEFEKVDWENCIAKLASTKLPLMRHEPAEPKPGNRKHPKMLKEGLLHPNEEQLMATVMERLL